MKAKAPEFPILGTPNTTSLTACRLCDDFFDVLDPHVLCSHIAVCITAMQSAKPTHSGKLPRTQGGKLYNLGVLPAAQLRQLLDFFALQHLFLDSRCSLPLATSAGSFHTDTLQTIIKNDLLQCRITRRKENVSAELMDIALVYNYKYRLIFVIVNLQSEYSYN